jgi:hypothetical protein
MLYLFLCILLSFEFNFQTANLMGANLKGANLEAENLKVNYKLHHMISKMLQIWNPKSTYLWSMLKYVWLKQHKVYLPKYIFVQVHVWRIAHRDANSVTSFSIDSLWSLWISKITEYANSISTTLCHYLLITQKK